jgi:hypothetical protein
VGGNGVFADEKINVLSCTSPSSDHCRGLDSENAGRMLGDKWSRKSSDTFLQVSRSEGIISEHFGAELRGVEYERLMAVIITMILVMLMMTMAINKKKIIMIQGIRKTTMTLAKMMSTKKIDEDNEEDGKACTDDDGDGEACDDEDDWDKNDDDDYVVDCYNDDD